MSIKKKTLKNNSAKFHQGLAVTVGLFLFAGVGAYLIFKGNALSPAVNYGNFYFDETERTAFHPAGQSFSAHLYADVPTGSYASTAGRMSVTVTVKTNPSDKNPAKRVQYNGYTCGELGTCTNLAGNGAGPGTGPGYEYSFTTCIDINPAKFGQQGVRVASINYKSLYSGSYFVAVGANWFRGSCNDHTAFGSFNKQFENATGGQAPGVVGVGTGGDNSVPGAGNGAGTGPAPSGSTSRKPKPTAGQTAPQTMSPAPGSADVEVETIVSAELEPEDESTDSKSEVSGDEVEKEEKRSKIVPYVIGGTVIILSLATGLFVRWRRNRIYY